jgi:hypothetical protein
MAAATSIPPNSGGGAGTGLGAHGNSGGAGQQGQEERIGDYVLAKEIGKGSFAIVMKAYRLVSVCCPWVNPVR